MIAAKPALLSGRRQPVVRDGVAMLVCCLALAVPLVIAPSAGNAFELPKALLVRTAVLLVGALAAARFLAAPRLAVQWVRWRLHNPLALALLAYAAVCLAASASYVVSGGYWRCAVAHDVNDDGLVTVYDIQVMADAWHDLPAPGYADRDRDGDVDMVDILRVTAHWGQIC